MDRHKQEGHATRKVTCTVDDSGKISDWVQM
jgi:hypothetical protein